jgi:hypothetical protein
VDKYRLLGESVTELERLTRSEATGYELTRASGILRQLFLDAQPLVHQVNRELKIPLVFKIGPNNAGRLLEAIPGASLHFTATTAPEDGSGIEVKLSAFLSHGTIAIHGDLFTVRDVIKCVAHVGGGVHHFAPQDAREAALYELASSMAVTERTILLHALADIAHAAVDSLQPLLRAITPQRPA